jgi:c-di-GMP-binding flagellar brake protein YcgR
LDSSAIKSTGSKVRCSNCDEIFKVFKPNAVEKRKDHRVKTQNLISYFSINEAGKIISHGLGIAMDISKGGILLQTPDAIQSNLIILAATDKKNNLFEVKGELAYSEKTFFGTFFSGIKFIESNERVQKFIVNLIKEYNLHGHNLYIRCHNEGPPPLPHDAI